MQLPTSYRAFIPMGLDSDYKTYQRLCEMSQGGIIYSRPIPQYIQDYYTTMQKAQKTHLHDTFLGFKISVNISWKPFWQSAWIDRVIADSMNLAYVSLASGNRIGLLGEYSELAAPTAPNEVKKLIHPPKRHYLWLKPYIYYSYFEVKMGASSAAVVALVDSQNGEIYAYTIEGVKYYTGWRQSIYTTWGYPSERNVYCKVRDKDRSFYDPIASLRALQSKGEKQYIEFLEQIHTYFKLNRTRLQELIRQGEKEEVEW